jgi:hypothetical protein
MIVAFFEMSAGASHPRGGFSLDSLRRPRFWLPRGRLLRDDCDASEDGGYQGQNWLSHISLLIS